MFTPEWVEVLKVLSLIVAVWFGLIGWTFVRPQPAQPE